MDSKSVISRALHGLECNEPFDRCPIYKDHDQAAQAIVDALDAAHMGTRINAVDANEYRAIVRSLGLIELTDQQKRVLANISGVSVRQIEVLIDRAVMASGR